MERMRLKLFAGEEPSDGGLQILLISSSQEYLEVMQKNLYITREVQQERRQYNLKVHTCKHVRDVIELKTADFNVDFIVFLLDAKSKNCLDEVQNNLNMLDSSFGREKLCLVNTNPSYDRSIVKPFDVWDFAHNYQINLINGKISDQEQTKNLSKRILNLAEACCGLLNGVPLVGYV